MTFTLKQKEQQSKEFVKKLIKKGIPKSSISGYLKISSMYPAIIINRKTPLYPKGKFGNYGLNKTYKTFNNKNVYRAYKFYTAKPKK